MALLLVGLLAARSSSATLLQPISDADLTRLSDAIVVGQVQRIQTKARKGGVIRTDVTIRVDDRIKGVPTSRAQLVVTVPGGDVPGLTARVFGAPEFVRGNRVLLFLRRGVGGRLRVTALALGVYHLAAAPGGTTRARRRVPDAEVRPLPALLSTLRGLVGDAPITDAGGGQVDDTDVLQAQDVETFVEPYAWMSTSPRRWFPEDVTYEQANGDSALGLSASTTALTQAMAAWTAVPTATLILHPGPITTPRPSVAGGVCDGRSVVQFDDPFGEVQDMTNCSGVLAVGGYCGSGATMTVNGVSMTQITEGDITMNGSIGSCWGATNVAEVLTHEIGHTIGLGHSGDATATMSAWAHFDGRGAALKADDAAGETSLYGVPGTPSTSSTSTSTTTSSTSSTATVPTTSSTTTTVKPGCA